MSRGISKEWAPLALKILVWLKKKKNVLVTRLSGKNDKFVFSDRLIQTAALKKERGGKNWEINILVREMVEDNSF